MTVMSPAQMDEAWAACFNAEDVDALVQLYETDAIFVPEPGGKPIAGRDAIREFAVNFPIKNASIVFRTGPVLERDQDALVYSGWTITGTGPDGPAEMEGQATVALRKQTDGGWLIAVDDPFSQR